MHPPHGPHDAHIKPTCWPWGALAIRRGLHTHHTLKLLATIVDRVLALCDEHKRKAKAHGGELPTPASHEHAPHMGRRHHKRTKQVAHCYYRAPPQLVVLRGRRPQESHARWHARRHQRLKWNSESSGTWSDEKSGDGRAVCSCTCRSSTICKSPPTDRRSTV